METLDLNDQDLEIYKEFVTENNLKNPIIKADEESAEIELSFDTTMTDTKVLYSKALYHFDLSVFDLTLNQYLNRTILTFYN